MYEPRRMSRTTRPRHPASAHRWQIWRPTIRHSSREPLKVGRWSLSVHPTGRRRSYERCPLKLNTGVTTSYTAATTGGSRDLLVAALCHVQRTWSGCVHGMEQPTRTCTSSARCRCCACIIYTSCRRAWRGRDGCNRVAWMTKGGLMRRRGRKMREFAIVRARLCSVRTSSIW